MVKLIDRFWHHISFLGVDETMTVIERKKQTIYNRLLIVLVTFGLISAFIQLIYFHNIIKFLAGSFGSIVIVILLSLNNSYNKTNKKIFVALFIPFLIVIASLLKFHFKPEKAFLLIEYLSPMVYLSSVLMLPILLFDLKIEKRIFILTQIFYVLIIILMPFIFYEFGYNIQKSIFTPDQISQFLVLLLVSLIQFLVTIFYLKYSKIEKILETQNLSLKKEQEQIKLSHTYLESKIRERTDQLTDYQQLLVDTQEIGGIASWQLNILNSTISWSKQMFANLGIEYDSNGDSSLSDFYKFIYIDDLQEIRKNIQNAVINGVDFSMEIRYLTTDGGFKWFLTQGKPKIENGITTSIVGMIFDINEIKKSQLAAASTRNNFKIVIEQSPIAIFFIKNNGEVMFANKMYYDLVEYFDDDYSFDIKKIFGDNIYNNITRVDTTIVPSNFFESNFITGRSKVKYINYSFSKVNIDGFEGNIVSILDITDRKVYEKLLLDSLNHEKQLNNILKNKERQILESHVKLQESLSHEKELVAELEVSHINLRQSLELATIGIWDIDLKSLKMIWSKEIYSFFALKSETFNLTIDNILKYINQCNKEYFIDVLKKAVSTKEDIDLQETITDDNGETKWLKVKGKIVYENDIAVKITGVVQNISSIIKQQNIDEKRIFQNQIFQESLLKIQKTVFTNTLEYYQFITKEISRVLEVERVGIWFFNENFDHIKCASTYSSLTDTYIEGEILKKTDTPVYFSYLENNLLISCYDAKIDPRTKEYADSYLNKYNIVSMLDIPIRNKGKLVGILCHEQTKTKREWTFEEQYFTTNVSEIISNTINIS